MTVLSERHAQVVLLDVMLPLLDVWQLMREIKHLPHGNAVKVILTGTHTDLYARAHELGAWGFLSRPFEATQLEAMLDKALGT